MNTVVRIMLLCWLSMPLASVVQASPHSSIDVEQTLAEVRAMRDIDSAAGLALLDALYESVADTADSDTLLAIALEYWGLAMARAEFAAGEARLQATLDRHLTSLAPADALRIQVAIADLIDRQARSSESFEMLEALWPDIEVWIDEEPGLYGAWLVARGNIHHDRAAYDLATADYLLALRNFELAQDAVRQGVVFTQLAITAMRARDHASALDYYQRAEALLELHPDSELSLSIYPNLGIVYQELGRIDDAVASYQRGFELALELDRPLVQAQSLLNIGTIYFNDGQLDEALDYYQQSLAICEAHDIGYGVLLNRINIGHALIKLADYEEAEAMLNEALAQTEQAGLKLESSQVVALLVELHRESGNFEQALLEQERYIEINEEIFNDNRDRAMAELRVQFETDLQAEQLRNKDIELARSQARTRMLSAIIALGLVVIGLGVWQYRNRERTLALLYARNRDLVDCQFGPQPRRSSSNLSASDDPADAAADAQTDDHLRSLYLELRDAVVNQALYQDRDLTINTLAAKVNSNRNYVSAALSRYGQGHFNGFINSFRINEARRLLSDPDDPPPMLELIERCGFSSRSTFYDAFKKEVGMTPSQFRTLAQRD